jgi:hypothetical protein
MDDAQISELASVFVRTLSAQNAVSMVDWGYYFMCGVVSQS